MCLGTGGLVEEFERRGEGAGRWGSFSWEHGSPSPLPTTAFPTEPDTATCRLRVGQPWGELGAGSAAQGCSWLAPWLALLKARAVNSALLKKSNKGEKKR